MIPLTRRGSILGRLSLGTKLLLAPAVGMLCLFIVAGAAYYGLTQQQYTMSKISDVRFAHLQLTMEANTFLQEAQFGLAGMFSTSQDVSDPALIKAAGDELLSKIQSALPTLDFLSKQSGLDPMEKKTIEATVESVRRYGKAVEEALTAATEHAGGGLNLKPDSAFELLSWNLATLVSIERKLTTQAFAESAQRSRQLALALACMLVLSFMAAFIVTAVVTRYIRATVEAIRVAASALASGDLTCRAIVLSDDEIGQTARAFNFLVNELAEKVSQLQVINQQLSAEMVEREAVERTLRESEERYRQLIEISPDAIMIEREGKITFVNSGALKLFGAASQEALLGLSLFELLADDWRQPVKDAFQQLLALDVEPRPVEGMMTRLDKTTIDVEITQSVFQYAGGTAIQTIVHDITKHKHHEEQLRKLALHDALTGLPNRILLMDRLDHAIVQAERHQYPIFVLFIDIDRFKLINDSLGHDVGDELLKAMAGRMAQCVRSGDTLARLGGDEFVILLGNTFAEDVLGQLINRILASVAEPMMLKGREVSVTCSIGYSGYPEDGRDAITLLKHADTAMYRAKTEGRNNIQRYVSEMYTRVNERMSIEMQLRRALEREEFLLYYQPQVDLRTDRITGVEALIRWQHPDLGLVPPLRFIPVAEDTRLIVPIGEWVIRTACRQAKAWQEAGLPPIKMSVNLSGQQLVRPELIEEVESALRAANLPAHYLELELTETVSMSDPQRTVEILQKFKEIGVSVAIDDFGTGYSNLAYLKLFPIQTLKLDRSFICEITEDSASMVIIQGIISIARGLHLKVVAEGVEEAAQLALLDSYGCDAIQGYYFSPPLPPEQCAALMLEDSEHGSLACQQRR
ncbi:diguanylate cyclase (GGDEF)-like protein/PAS domain S-box-containing protein [Oxalobacteraceae bacterium GrIS 1.11]